MPNFGVGDQTLWGWAPEVTAGTFVSPTDYIVLAPGQPAPRFNPARGNVEVAAGSPNVVAAVVDRKGSGTWQVGGKLYPTANTAFMTACGLTSSGVVAPTPLSLQVNAGGRSLKYAGCRATRIALSSSMDNDLEFTISGIFTTRPTPASLLAPPSLTLSDPYIWTDLGGVTLLTGATSFDVESWSLTIDLPHALGYANTGVPLANVAKHSRIVITGQVQLYMNDTNYVELAAMFAAGGTGGSLNFPYVKGANNLTIALPNCKYTTGEVPMPAGGLDMLTLPIASYTPTLSNQLTFTAA